MAPGAKYKTSLCRNFAAGSCALGDRCQFAHGEAELRSVPTGPATPAAPPHKKRTCIYFIQGSCRHGDRCTFYHPGVDPEPPGGAQPAAAPAALSPLKQPQPAASTQYAAVPAHGPPFGALPTNMHSFTPPPPPPPPPKLSVPDTQPGPASPPAPKPPPASKFPGLVAAAEKHMRTSSDVEGGLEKLRVLALARGRLKREQLTELLFAAAVNALNPRLLQGVIELVDPEVHGDWTLLGWWPEHEVESDEDEHEEASGGGGFRRVMYRRYVCTPLLHMVGEETAEAYEAGDRERGRDGLQVLSAICAKRPSAVLDLKEEEELYTPLEHVLLKRRCQPAARPVLELLAPLTWLHTPGGRAGQERALQLVLWLCDPKHQGRRTAAQVATLRDLASVLSAQLDRHPIPDLVGGGRSDGGPLAWPQEALPGPARGLIMLPELPPPSEDYGPLARPKPKLAQLPGYLCLTKFDPDADARIEDMSDLNAIMSMSALYMFDDLPASHEELRWGARLEQERICMEQEAELLREEERRREAQRAAAARLAKAQKEAEAKAAKAVAAAAKQAAATAVSATAAGSKPGTAGMGIFKGIFAGGGAADGKGAPQSAAAQASAGPSAGAAKGGAAAGAPKAQGPAGTAGAAAQRQQQEEQRRQQHEQQRQQQEQAAEAATARLRKVLADLKGALKGILQYGEENAALGVLQPILLQLSHPNMQAVYTCGLEEAGAVMGNEYSPYVAMDKAMKGKKGGGGGGSAAGGGAKVSTTEGQRMAEVAQAVREAMWMVAMEHQHAGIAVQLLDKMANMNLPWGYRIGWETIVDPHASAGGTAAGSTLPLWMRLMEQAAELQSMPASAAPRSADTAWTLACYAVQGKPEIVSSGTRNPLAFAAKLSAPERVMLLIARACQRSRPNAVHGEPLEGYTALGWTVKRKRWMELHRFFDVALQIFDVKDLLLPAMDDLPPLHYAVRNKDEEMAVQLLYTVETMRGAGQQTRTDMVNQSHKGVTPLYRAVGAVAPQQRSEALAAQLVSREANPLVPSYTAHGFQDTPLHAAVAANDAAMVRLLLRLDVRADGAAEGAFRTEDYAELDGGEEEEATQAPAFRKAQRGKADAFFTQAKQVSKAQDAEGLTPLMLAAKTSSLAAMRVLLEARADPTALRALPAAEVGGAAGGAKGGKKAKSSGLSTAQVVRPRADGAAAPAKKPPCGVPKGSHDSLLSRVLCAGEDGSDEVPDKRAVLELLLGCWRPQWSGTAMQRELGGACCRLMREWLQQHADTTLWPVVKELNQKASTSPRGIACARWLSAALLELLMQLCTKAGGDTWCAAGEDAPPWSGPPGTQPLPRVSVWHLISAFARATDAQQPPAPGSAAWMPPASLSPSMTQELLRRGIMSASERAPGTGTGPNKQASTSSLLHKACQLGDVGLVGELLRAGADPMARDADGNTPLHVAVNTAHPDATSLALLKKLLGGECIPSQQQQQAGSEDHHSEDRPQGGASAQGDSGAAGTVAAAAAAHDIAVLTARLEAAKACNKQGLKPEFFVHHKKLRKTLNETVTALQKLKSAKEQALQKATASGQGAESTAAPTEDPAAPAGKKASKASTNEAETSGAAAEREQQNEEADQQQQPEELAQPKRRVLTAQDASLPDTELSSLQLCELATCPESIALGMAVRLATLLPANVLRTTAVAPGGAAQGAAGGAAGSGAAEGADSAAANAATNRELQRIVEEMRLGGEEEDGAGGGEGEGGEGGDAAALAYSDDDEPPPGESIVEDEDVLRQELGSGASQQGAAAAAAAAAGVGNSNDSAAITAACPAAAPALEDSELVELLRRLPWRFVITRQAYEAWGRLPDRWRRLVLTRLAVIGKGFWPRCRGAKKLSADDPTLMQQELWRLKITRAGRILFEVAVEYDEESRTWAEMIRLWFVTLDHKAYEAMIGLVRASFRRTLAMRERLQLQPVADDTCAAAGKAGSKAAGGKGPAAPKPAAAGGSRDTQRLPRHYKEADPSVAREWRKQQQQQQQQERQLPQQPGGAGATPGSTVSLREQFPPASWADDSYTLMKFYNLDKVLVAAVLQGLKEAQVEFPFKLSPREYELITLVPNPPSSIILLGRSGTGKTTCAVYRLWGSWLAHHTNPVGMDPVHSVFVTASATLREQVARAFRRLQSAVLRPEQWARVQAASGATYHTFRDVPDEAFPLFLSSKAYLRMLDGTTSRPFFPRTANGAIIQRPDDTDDPDPDGAAMVVALDEDASEDEEDEPDEQQQGEEGDQGDGEQGGQAGADDQGGVVALEEEVAAAAAARAAEVARAGLLQELGAAAGAAAGADDGYGLGVAGRAWLNREVTYQYFVSHMWKQITTPEQRNSVAPALVYQEIVSYIKGSAEAIASPTGHISLEGYLSLGRKRAVNFGVEQRSNLVWPIFERYERLKRQEWRYDLLDLVGHVFRQVAGDSGGAPGEGYGGTPLHVLYRDEVQDFTQGELLLDLAVTSDPNALFYCGDTAQTIARGIGFRFKDIQTLFYDENTRRRAREKERLAALGGAGRSGHGVEIAVPDLRQLTTNYRTHQGILDVAALVVDVLRRYFPLQLDRMDREKALFPGPHPLLLGGISADDLAILLSGSDRNTSQVEFGAHQVILVRSMEAAEKLPEDIRESNAIIMTVPQAKGLEFDDVFIVDFFADSPAASEWRLLSAYLADLAQADGLSGDGHVYTLQQVTPPDPGAVRPLAFDPDGGHVLLAEELKHLYTAITRAKNNVVIFDSNTAKRAPFYHLLQTLGLARTVHKSLLEDGKDAVRYGLTQQATSSRAEWAKRARNLLDNRNYAMARKAFGQAADPVRMEVADAYLKRQRAQTEDSPAEKKRLLAAAAMRLLSAAMCAAESPDPVEPPERRRWVALAAKFLQACGEATAASRLLFKLGSLKHRQEALRVLADGKQHRAAAECCIEAASVAASHAEATAKGELGLGLGLLAPQQQRAQRQALKAAREKHVLPWLAKAVEQYSFAGDGAAMVALLAPPGTLVEAVRQSSRKGSNAEDAWSDDDEALQEGEKGAVTLHPQLSAFADLAPGLHDMLRRRWLGSYGRALQRVAVSCRMAGRHGAARALVRLLPGGAEEQDALLMTLGYERERARMKRSSDPLGAAELLLAAGDSRRAARLVATHIARRVEQQQKQQDRQAEQAAAGAASAAGSRPAGEVQVEERAWELLHRCISAQTDAQSASLLRKQLEPQGKLAAALSNSGSSAAKRLLVYQGQALLLEARLVLQPWVAAPRSSGGKGAATAPKASGGAAPPASWESRAAEEATTGADAGAKGPQQGWVEAEALLREAAACFARGGNQYGLLEGLALGCVASLEQKKQAGAGESPEVTASILESAGVGAAEAAAALAAEAAAAATAAQLSAPRKARGAEASKKDVQEDGSDPNTKGSKPPAPSRHEVLLKQAELAVGLVRLAQHASAALGKAPDPTSPMLLQLEQHYGLDGLRRPLPPVPGKGKDPMVAVRPGTNVWWALVGPRCTAATRAKLGAGSAGAAAAGGSKWGKKQEGASASYAAAAASNAPVPLHKVRTGDLMARWTKAAQATADASPGFVPDEVGLLTRARVTRFLVRDISVKAACAAHVALKNAVEAWFDGAGKEWKTDSRELLARLRPVLRAVRCGQLAARHVKAVQQFDLPKETADALSQALSALLNRAMAIAAATSLLPAPRSGSLAELLQPPKYHPSGLRDKPPPSIGALLGLCVEESLAANDLMQWVTDVVAGRQLRGRLPLAPGPSYVLWRTGMVVLRDRQAGRIFRLAGGSLPPEVPNTRVVRSGPQWGPPEALLQMAFDRFRSVPENAVDDLLYYLAWCARRDGLLQASAPGGSTGGAAGGQSQGGATAKRPAGPSQGRVPVRSLPLEAYVELLEVGLGQLLLGACDTALLASNVMGSLEGLPWVTDPRAHSVEAVAAKWRHELGYDPPEQRRLLRAAYLSQLSNYYRSTVRCREMLAKQLVLGARLVCVLAGHLASLAAAEAAREGQAAKVEAAAAEGRKGTAAAAASEASEASGGDATEAGEGKQPVATPLPGSGLHALLTEELLPLLEAPDGEKALALMLHAPPDTASSQSSQGGSSGADKASAPTQTAAASAPSASGARLLALARRVLLVAVSGFLSLELQMRFAAASSAAAASAPEKERDLATLRKQAGGPPPRGNWPPEALQSLRAACGLLAEHVAPSLFELQTDPKKPGAGPSTSAALTKAPRASAMLSHVADCVALLGREVCGPEDSGLVLVEHNARRPYMGLKPLAKAPKGAKDTLTLLVQAAQAAVPLPQWQAPQRQLQRNQQREEATDPATSHTGLLRGAMEAVAAVALEDYRTTRDDVLKRNEAATTIQRAWREYRQRQADRRAEADRKQLQAEVLGHLRQNMTLRSRVTLRIFLRTLRARAELRREQQRQGQQGAQAGLAAGAAADGANGAVVEDEFGFAATKRTLQAVNFIDQVQVMCPVCPPPNAQRPTAAGQQTGQDASGLPTSPSPKTGLSAMSFIPHKQRDEHLHHEQLFGQCYDWYLSRVAVFLAWGDQLLADLTKAQETTKGKGNELQLAAVEQSMLLQSPLSAVRTALQTLVKEHNWAAGAEHMAQHLLPPLVTAEQEAYNYLMQIGLLPQPGQQQAASLEGFGDPAVAPSAAADGQQPMAVPPQQLPAEAVGTSRAAVGETATAEQLLAPPQQHQQEQQVEPMPQQDFGAQMWQPQQEQEQVPSHLEQPPQQQLLQQYQQQQLHQQELQLQPQQQHDQQLYQQQQQHQDLFRQLQHQQQYQQQLMHHHPQSLLQQYHQQQHVNYNQPHMHQYQQQHHFPHQQQHQYQQQQHHHQHQWQAGAGATHSVYIPYAASAAPQATAQQHPFLSQPMGSQPGFNHGAGFMPLHVHFSLPPIFAAGMGQGLSFPPPSQGTAFIPGEGPGQPFSPMAPPGGAVAGMVAPGLTPGGGLMMSEQELGADDGMGDVYGGEEYDDGYDLDGFQVQGGRKGSRRGGGQRQNWRRGSASVSGMAGGGDRGPEGAQPHGHGPPGQGGVLGSNPFAALRGPTPARGGGGGRGRKGRH